MILVVGRPGLDGDDELARPAGLIAVAAARQGGRVELVGAVGDDPAGERVALLLGQAGVGHAALLRDPAGATPRAGAAAGRLPRLDAEDLELGLSYLVECRVLVLAERLDERALGVARAAAAYHSAALVAVVEPGQPAPLLPDSATVLEQPADDAGAFAELIGRYATRLAAGEAPARAWQSAVRGAGWERTETDDADGADGAGGAPRVTEAASTAPEPVVVYGDAVLAYDFGPGHPLTPRRFAPSIGLLRALGAKRFVDPPVASDEQIARVHTADYIAQVRSMGDDPWEPPAAGIGSGDCPAFAGMHEASAVVVGGSLTATDMVLRGEVDHAFNPGGGLHHAMAGLAAGFCIYNDVALAVARARDAGHRVLYVDLDVHHGDGVQALFWDDPQVLTFSIHQSGRTLFPGTGFVSETGGPLAPGTAVNVPLEPYSGNDSWLPIVRDVVPALAELFRPTFLVSQHGCDSHALDPLAHLRLTTAAYREATTLLDEVAHRWCEGRWIATGGGGYDVYRVVPRSWGLVWLAQAHRDVPTETDAAWREAWAAEAASYSQSPPPTAMIDPDELVAADPEPLLSANRRTAERALDQARHLLGAR